MLHAHILLASTDDKEGSYNANIKGYSQQHNQSHVGVPLSQRPPTDLTWTLDQRTEVAALLLAVVQASRLSAAAVVGSLLEVVVQQGRAVTSVLET